MESYSSGRFHEYNTTRPDVTGTEIGNGGAPGGDACDREIESARLEEIERSEYFKAKSKVPKPGDDVELRTALSSGRLCIEHVKTGLSTGFLPTSFNYLVQCMAAGKTYRGKVTASADSPSARVVISLSPA